MTRSAEWSCYLCEGREAHICTRCGCGLGPAEVADYHEGRAPLRCSDCRKVGLSR
jgi:hypothetical protein